MKSSSSYRNTRKTGALGEQLATEYLVNKGYRILELNWQHHHLELDIIAQVNRTLVIVEVKTVRTVDSGRDHGMDPDSARPEEKVTRQKQLHLIHAANAYVMYRNIQAETRFDIITILLGPEGPVIAHFEDAFSASG